jgi:hypothetical protein
MQVTAEDEIEVLVRFCLPALETIEAAFVRDCWLREPKVPLTEFSKQWHLSGKALTELRSRVLVRMKKVLATRGVKSVADIC